MCRTQPPLPLPAPQLTTRLTNLFDITYTADFQFGTPEQSFPVIVDTGSAQFWLYSEKCKECGKGYVDVTKSSTFHALGRNYSQSYGDGKTWITGYFATDRVGFGGIFTDNATVGIADTSVNMNLEQRAAGISGWSWPATLKDGTELEPLPYLQATKGQWKNKEFGMYLNRAGITAGILGVESKRKTGALTVNGVDRQFFDGELQYFPRKALDKRTAFAWGLDLDGITVNGKFFDTHGSGAVMDSGTTIIYGPKALVQDIYKQIPGATDLGEGVWVLPECPKNNTVSFRFGGKEFPIFPADLNAFSIFGCQGAISYNEKLNFGNNWLVGDAFLKSYYTAYSYDPPQIGFAKVKEGL